MELIDKIVLPQSAQHMILLKYILVLTFLLFIPYASVLFGSFILSLFFQNKFKKNSDVIYKNLSIELIDFVTFSKGIAFTLGLIPLLSSAFCYAQLLHLSGLIVPETILISAFLFLIALISIYSYKHSLHLKNIIELNTDKKSNESEKDFQEYNYRINRVIKTSSYSGLLFLIISTYLFVSSVEFTQDSEKWNYANNIFGIIFSLNALIGYLQFILFSLIFTSTFLLVKYGKIVNNADSYKNYIKNFSLKLGLTSTVLLPVLVILSIFTKSKLSLSYNVFGFTLLALIFLLLISILFYAMIKQNEVKYGLLTIFLFFLVISFLIIKEQFAFNTSAKKHFVYLAANYESYQKKLLEESGLLKETINGADIFNSKCIACHQFDRRVVGPPYNEVLPKYEGKRQELVSFILNPTKKNPDYPPMPNQGLKPKEAEAVAEFIMSNYKK